MELLILAVMLLLGGEAKNGDTKETGEADSAYDKAKWQKVAQGFARKLAWRVYKNLTDDTFELAFKNPEGLFSEGGFESKELAETRGKEIGQAGAP